MKLELDKRIESLSDVFNFSDAQNAKKFIGQKGYFTNTIYFLENIQSCQYGTLMNLFTESFSYNVFRRKEDGAYYEYFIPESFLKPKEKRYRPYTFKEFKGLFPIGQPIKYRRKGNVGLENEIVLDGYAHEQRGDQIFTYIFIGVEEYTLQELFEDYEWQDPDTGEWDIFGVKE